MESIFTATLLNISYLSLFVTPQTSSSASFELFPLEKRDSIHVVKPGESLSSISFQYYDSTEYWSSLFVDNTQLTSPNIINEGTKLKVRAKPIANAEKHTRIAQITPQPEIVISPILSFNQPVLQPVVTPAPSDPPTPPITSGVGPLNDAQIQFLGNCEAGMNPTTNTGNGYYGAFQFSYGTWQRMNTGYERADLAPLDVQIAAVQQLLSRSSIFTQFPACARKMQAAGLL